jgi:signal peptidase I
VAKKKTDESKPESTTPPSGIKKKSAFREYVEAIGIALVLALCLRFFVIEAFKIPSGSMIETLNIGDFIFVNKFSYRTEIPYSVLGVKIPAGGTTLKTWNQPERGDVMVFRYPDDQKVDYIKRIIGLPGDEIRLRRNELYVNGEKYDRSFVRSVDYKDKNCTPAKGRLYMESDGSREYPVLLRDGPDVFENYGPTIVKPGHIFAMGDNRDNSSDSRAWGQVPIGNIKGEALFVWLSVNRCGGFMDRIRWSRFGHRVK